MSTPIQRMPLPLSHYLLEKPEEIAQNHQWHSTLYCTAMVISAIGALTIFGGITALYLGLFGEASLSGAGTLGVIVSGSLCALGVDVFAKWQINAQHMAKWYGKLNIRLEEVKNWQEPVIRTYFAAYNRPLENIPPESLAILQQINPHHPYKALLPLVARCHHIKHYALKWSRKNTEQAADLENVQHRPPEIQANLRRIYEALLVRSQHEKARYELLLTQHLNLLA